jgi:hypothetical protein
MEGEYPRFKSSYLQEELAEAFQLRPDEFNFVFRYRSDHNESTKIRGVCNIRSSESMGTFARPKRQLRKRQCF